MSIGVLYRGWQVDYYNKKPNFDKAIMKHFMTKIISDVDLMLANKDISQHKVKMNVIEKTLVVNEKEQNYKKVDLDILARDTLQQRALEVIMCILENLFLAY